MIHLSGDWNLAKKVINVNAFAKAAITASLIANKRAALYVERKIKEELRGGPFTPNSPLTIKRKRSSKPLIDSGDLFGSITHIILSPTEAWVGVPEAKSKNGNLTLADIAQILQGGAIGEIPKDVIIKPKKAKLLFIPLKKKVKAGDPGLKYGVDFTFSILVRIKPRPFILPAVIKAEPIVLEIYRQSFKAVLQRLIR
jgi:hypothetical protein